MADDKKLHRSEFPLDGKLITREEPCKIGPNFQQLTNLRYTPATVRGIGGMTKITSAVLNATYLKARSAIHFKKDQPAESHVLVDAFNTGLTASRILDNTTTIPSAGNFSATTLYSPTTSSPAGRFSLAPDGDVAYCNGEESIIWGGNEREIASFINYDPDGTFSYDYTEQVSNTKTDSDNVALLHERSVGIDANVMLLLHFDNDVVDSSPTTPHTIANSGVTFSTTTDPAPPLGTHWAVFNGSVNLSASDNVDFDFSATGSNGVFTIDFRVVFNYIGSATDWSIYYQYTTNDNTSFNVMVDQNGAVLLRIKSGGTKQFSGGTDFKTADGVIEGDTLYHIEIVENGNDWYIFVNGALQAYTSDTARAENYNSGIVIGYDLTTYFIGKLDEFRISNSARHTSAFDMPTLPYSLVVTEIDFYIASVRPLDGFKLYVSTANTAASAMTVYYWSGTLWTDVTNKTDNTSAGGISLAQTGTVTFDSTASVAKLKYFQGVLAYWYKVVISASASSPALSYVTISAPFQSIKDIWDGTPRLIDSFQIYKGSYTDATLNVRENEYDSSNTGTFVELDSLTTTTQWIICGFTEKMAGVIFNFVNGHENSTSGTVCSVYYWSGSAWTTVGTIDDGTLSGSISFGKTGAVTWQPPSSEFTQNINAARTLGGVELATSFQKKTKIKYKKKFIQTVNNEVQLYYYKFVFSKSLDSDVILYNVSGIPAQTKIESYKFPFMANDRLFLCSDQESSKNTVICSSEGSSSVFNGDDSLTFKFGDSTELTTAAWLFTSQGSSIYNVMMFFKNSEIWAIIGNDPDDWIKGKYRISSTIGCVAPETLKVIDLGSQNQLGLNRMIAVFQAFDGIYVSDGRAPIKISEDIDDKFDQRKSSCINANMISKSTSGWDNFNKCYHWHWASGSNTTLDQEFVFDFKKMGWFNIDRGTAKAIQYNIGVKDTNGMEYNYGFIDSGYMERLEYGTSFDTNAIVQTFWTGDIATEQGSISVESKPHYTCLIAKAKSTTSNSVTLTHYSDGKSTGNSWSVSPQKSGYSLVYPVEHHSEYGAAVFHSIKAVLSTNDETIGFEPLYLYILGSIQRDHLRDWR